MEPLLGSRTLLVPRATSSQQAAAPNGVSGMLSTAIPTGIIALIFLSVFLIFRPKHKRIYMPRTYLGSLQDNEHTPRVSDSKFGWVKEFLRMSDEYVLSHHSLDAYLLIRFFKVIIIFCGCAWPLTWIVLMSVYGTSHGGNQQFDKISYSNINSNIDGNRLYAVVFVSWVVLGGAMWLIGRELVKFVQLKQAYTLLPAVASRLSRRTVLFTNVPDEYLDEAKLREAMPHIKHVWLSTQTSDLDDLLKDRNKTAMKLEGAEVKLSKMANKNRLKAQKKAAKSGTPLEANEDPLHWINEKKRPTHRLKFLVGKKVDTIDWSREHLAEVIPKVEEQQATHWNGKAKNNSAVFVEFTSVQAAEAAYYKTNIKPPKSFDPREIGTRPQEMIWGNMNLGTSQRKIRNIVAKAACVFIIIFFVPITIFVGALTNINSLINKVPFLGFIRDIPGPILGVVTGLLPTIILAVCLILVPIIMRLLFKLAGAISKPEVELRTQYWYFVFQVIQVFLLTTLASGAAATVTTIVQSPGQAPTLLAQNLPKASNFYINYYVLYGFTFASKALLNIAALALYIILGKFLDNTPRKIFKRYTKLSSFAWGSAYPVYTNLGVIAITYSCIAPLELGFACISFALLYFAFRYQVFFTIDTLAIDTQGKSFKRALNQLTTGVYLAELCLIGLFAISTSATTKATGPLVLEIIFLVATVIFHVFLNRVVASMEKNVSRMDGPSQSIGSNVQSQETIEDKDAPYRQGSNSQDAEERALAKPSGVPKFSSKLQDIYIKILRPGSTPTFDPWLSTAFPEYQPDEQREAYTNPAVTSPSPLLWIVKDSMGISEREKEATGKVIGITDEGAWFDEKTGKIKVTWSDQPEDVATAKAKEAPIYEKPVYY